MRVLNQKQKLNNSEISLAAVRRLLLLTVAVLLLHTATALSVSAQARDVYITPDGGGSGVCTNNTHPPSWFNNSSNWGSGAAQIGPGTVVHLCGTFTAGVGATLLSAQGGGTSGNSTSILFENGTSLQSPAFTAAIDISGRHYITIDGGANGVIKNTANGTNSSNHLSPTRGVLANDCTPGCRVTNLSITDLYVRNANDATNGVDQAAVNAITFLRAPGMRVDNNVLTNCGWCINGFGTGMEIDHNNVSKIDHGVASGCGGTCTGSSVHDNHFHDMGQWDTTNNSYHHDGIHFFSEGGSTQNVLIYNNLFDGSLGVNTTAWIFMEGVDGGLGIHGAIIFNNVLMDSLASGKTMLWMEGHGASSNNAAYNNYFYDGHGGGLGMFIRQEANFSAKNNIAGIVSYQSTTVSGVDHNVYYDANADFGNNNLFGWNGSTVASIASWRTLCGCDGAGQLLASSLINAVAGLISSPSKVTGAGSNLTSLGIAALNADKNGNPRPASGSWDVGAYTSGGAASAVPDPPTSLKAVVN